jgi:LmbE family N-acetylglucosaminyl deacetylase
MAGELTVERILVVTAHPDDVDFGVAGSVATWTSQGIEVHYCVCTDGDAGGFDETITRAEMGRVRRREQTAAAAAVGVTDLHFLGHPDGRLYVTHELRHDITRVIRTVRPQRVVCQSPERNLDRIYASHPDHLAAGEATLCAVYPDARNPFAHGDLLETERLEPWTVGEVYLMAHPKSDVWVDVTDTFDRKVAALLCHESQRLEREGPGTMERMLREWGTRIAAQGDLPEGHLAEGFRRIDTR